MGTGGVAAGEISMHAAPLRAGFSLSEPTLPPPLPKEAGAERMISKGMVLHCCLWPRTYGEAP